jgi:hypothetical protein
MWILQMVEIGPDDKLQEKTQPYLAEGFEPFTVTQQKYTKSNLEIEVIWYIWLRKELLE